MSRITLNYYKRQVKETQTRYDTKVEIYAKIENPKMDRIKQIKVNIG